MAFINKLFLIIKVKMKYIITTAIDKILKIILLFFFIKGLLTVSEGAYMLIISRTIKNKVINMFLGITNILHRYAPPKNNVEENKRHIQLLLACIPKANNLIKLNDINRNINSLNTPSIRAINEIIIVLVIVR